MYLYLSLAHYIIHNNNIKFDTLFTSSLSNDKFVGYCF